jgi:hypothetical protein
MLDKGFWADVKLAGEHLRLFSEDNVRIPGDGDRQFRAIMIAIPG